MSMSCRDRFKQTMCYGTPDRVPYFEEGIRPEVLRVWRRQGMPTNLDIKQRFPTDPRIEIELDLEPRPSFKKKWPTKRSDLAEFRRRLDANDSKRLPRGWRRLVRRSSSDPAVRMLRVSRGLFLSMGVRAWDRFYQLMSLLADDPYLVRDAIAIQGEFAAALTKRVLQDIEIDAAIFSEPIGGNDRPLISPDMYDELVLSSYAPVIKVLKQHSVDTIILRTFANARILIPRLLNRGFNCLWACEVNIDAMNYRSLRNEFGRELRLIGGIDLDALRQGKDKIKQEVLANVPDLLASGGYVPLADGRVREDIPYENYVYYRELLLKFTQ